MRSIAALARAHTLAYAGCVHVASAVAAILTPTLKVATPLCGVPDEKSASEMRL